jgi:hypothetical protein
VKQKKPERMQVALEWIPGNEVARLMLGPIERPHDTYFIFLDVQSLEILRDKSNEFINKIKQQTMN